MSKVLKRTQCQFLTASIARYPLNLNETAAAQNPMDCASIGTSQKAIELTPEPETLTEQGFEAFELDLFTSGSIALWEVIGGIYPRSPASRSSLGRGF